jgi:hypothetical protein
MQMINNGTSASLALCKCNGYLACWWVRIIARGGAQLQQVESFPGHIHDSKIGKQLCNPHRSFQSEQCGCSCGVHTHGAAGSVTDRHPVSHSCCVALCRRVRTGRPSEWPPRPGMTMRRCSRSRVDALVSKSPPCAVAGCGVWSVSGLQDHLALVKQQSD